jgi:hypothetical protein
MQVLAPAMCCPAVDCVVYVDFWRGDGLPSFPVFETFECVLIAFAPLRHEPTAFVRLLHPYIASVFRSFDSNDQVRSRIPEIPLLEQILDIRIMNLLPRSLSELSTPSLRHLGEPRIQLVE